MRYVQAMFSGDITYNNTEHGKHSAVVYCRHLVVIFSSNKFLFWFPW